jgi:hypothetical protein
MPNDPTRRSALSVALLAHANSGHEVVEVGRLELPCLVFRAHWSHAAPIAESGL